MPLPAGWLTSLTRTVTPDLAVLSALQEEQRDVAGGLDENMTLR